MDIKKAIEYAEIALRNLLICNGTILNPDTLESEMWMVYRLYNDEQIHKEVLKMKKEEK